MVSEITLKPHYLDIPPSMNAWILTDMCTSAAKDIRCEISLQLRLYEECTIYIFYLIRLLLTFEMLTLLTTYILCTYMLDLFQCR